MREHNMAASGKKYSKASQAWERLQLRRLIWVLLLFLAVFLGKRIYPQQMLAVGEEVVQVLGSSIDLELLLSDLGSSMTGEGGALEGLETFCAEVFGAQTEADSTQIEKIAVFQPIFPGPHAGLLTEEMEKHALDIPGLQESGVTEEDSIPAVGTVLTVGDEPARELPEGYTMDELSFGALETVAPVLGRLNSGFGYRDHPVNGVYGFHGGADISANAGDPIAAFANGTVEYIGEDNSYGLYLQLDHGNGIKSFYAHCQSVCVEKGAQVAAGETVAKVGATGRVTGPHLHLELKCCGVRVDPAYYVEFL